MESVNSTSVHCVTNAANGYGGGRITIYGLFCFKRDWCKTEGITNQENYVEIAKHREIDLPAGQ